ncbi:YqhA family protein [Roseomonas sp. USHLN139]|uniref:YqhA family protein n=1 Tax=Roseomonas sp. USHLN139 TaxID=3081298 RepID=UPI003B019F5F
MLTLIDKAMLASRHILTVFFLGLVVALGLYALRFVTKLWEFSQKLFQMQENDDLLELLHMADSALVASMVAMIAISSYDSLVSRLKEHAAAERMHWVGGLDTGDLKLKLATSIVAISSIQLLQMFLRPGRYDSAETMWALAIYGSFLLGALTLGLLERIGGGKETTGAGPQEVNGPDPKETGQERE